MNPEICDAVCCSSGVVEKVLRGIELLRHYDVKNTINIVLTKLNLPSLWEPLKTIKERDIPARIGIAQRPINASDEYIAVGKGECYAGTIAYSIGTDGSVKACQCDIKTYGNILRDNFGEIY